MNKCANCETITHNPKFCSKSCAAIVNNKIPKRKLFNPIIKCKVCQIEFNKLHWKDRRTLCDSCNASKVDWNLITLGEAKAKRKYQNHSRVRGLARITYLKSLSCKPACLNCGYSTHIEVCHIKPVHTFSDDTSLAKINDISNLIGLCRNCHWEFDNNKLPIERIPTQIPTENISLEVK